MIRGRTMVLALGGLAIALPLTRVLADVPANPYQRIIDRNVFSLRPIPKPSPNIRPPTPPPPKITLTGFTTILGDKRVLFKVSIPPKPRQKPKEEFYILREGQRKGDIEALAIDAKAGVAKFDNHGTVQTLNIRDNGVKPPTASSVPKIPPRPGGRVLPFAGRTPRIAPRPQQRRVFPTRTLRIPQMPTKPASNRILGYPPRNRMR